MGENMSIIERIARKICCAAGEHCYSTLMWKYTFISYDHDSLCYEVSNECVYCGKPVWSLVNIPEPKEVKE